MAPQDDTDGETPETNQNDVLGASEMAALKRVFVKLCFYAEKAKISKEMLKLKEKRADLKTKELPWLLRKEREEDKVTQQLKKVDEERGELEQKLKSIEARPEQNIRRVDIAAALRRLGKIPTKKEVHDMIWEVDEKNDNVVDWEEFLLMFERNLRDKTGLEPSSLYFMVQYLIYDRNDNWSVSLDEAMEMLYPQLGKAEMESVIQKLFTEMQGVSVVERGRQGGEISFSKYFEVANEEKKRRFWASDHGKNLGRRQMRPNVN